MTLGMTIIKGSNECQNLNHIAVCHYVECRCSVMIPFIQISSLQYSFIDCKSIDNSSFFIKIVAEYFFKSQF